MIASTRRRVSSLKSGERLMTLETVFFETPDSRATSLIVGRRTRGASDSSFAPLGARSAGETDFKP